jgi:hypothetical protein
MATVPCWPNTRHGRAGTAVPARHCDGLWRAAVLAVPCLTVLWAAHGPFTRAVPPWATVIFTVPCRPMARQHVFNKITYNDPNLPSTKQTTEIQIFMKLTIIKRSCVQCCLIKNLSR